MPRPTRLVPNYNRIPLRFTHGEGAYLFAEDGSRYLDFCAGIAVNVLGHAHPRLVQTLREQSERLWHVSNLYEIPENEILADKLIAHAFDGRVFFCNSGAEANEAAVKLMRRAQSENGHPERTEIICFDGAFHGRTLAMLAATANPNYRKGFEPLPPGFKHARYNDFQSVLDLVTEKTAGILLEPVQGEGGVACATPQFLKNLRDLCDTRGIYLALDEIQTGVGRTGEIFAYRHSPVTPDILCLAKGLGGGFPIGAVIAREDIARHLTPGTHGTTFGGNPLACSVASTVIDIVGDPDFLKKVSENGAFLANELDQLVENHPNVFRARRGLGYMQGLECIPLPGVVMQRCLEQKLLTVPAGRNVLRLLPPLIADKKQCREAVAALERAAVRLETDLAQTPSQ